MSPEATDFLYPFIEADERDAGTLLADLAASAEGKAVESNRVVAESVERCGPGLAAAAEAMAERFRRGGQVFCFGNGGSATDAATVAATFARPPRQPEPRRSLPVRPLPARSFVADEAVLTALGNDVGFELVFSRQLIAHAHPDDIAVGLSTSGNSLNVIRAFAEARHRRLLTIGFAGYDGGKMASCGDVDHCLVVRSDSVHRIQEAQARLAYELWAAVQEILGHDG